MEDNKMIKMAENAIEKLRDEQRKTETEFKELKAEAKDHKETLEKYRKERDLALVEDEKALNALEKKIEKTKTEYSKLMQPHNEAVNKMEELTRIQKSITSDIARVENQLKILKAQAEGWIIFSIDAWKSTHLGKFQKNNYRPQGWRIVEILAKPNGFYVKTNISAGYRKILEPGNSNVTMVKLEDLVLDEMDEERIKGHNCKNPKIIKGRDY